MRRLTMLALLAGSCALPALAHAQTREVLPKTVTPSHYDLAFHPDLAAHRFTATNTVTLAVASATQNIVLNAKGLTIDAATLDGGTQGSTTLNPALERATIHFASPVTPGRHVLTIAYHGAIGGETLGLFGMDYEVPGGKATIMATNLEPASARQVFPGWDEPAIKATYTVSVDAPKGLVAVSNMPVASSVALSPTLSRVTFAQSPKMSSYLFFLGLGDWERLHKSVDGVDVGVMVKRGDAAKGAYALDQAAALLHWYNGYFGTPYPLPKLDLIAAPGAIQGGSMENWGAIFYSQEHLLFDPAKSTESDRQLVFEVVAHEMAHQWFGDLVTMAWWDNLWLNEGFARWMQTRAADALHPEWQTGLRAQTIFEGGREVDALPASHPIIQPILTANQASQAFDGITYDKGAAVITMLIADIGDDHFRNGLQRYMKAHAYGNTVDADLWSIMQQEAGKPILAIEHDFTTQAGVPLIRVSTTPKGLHLSEDIFRSNGPGEGTAGQHWQVPLTVRPLGGKGLPFSLDGAGDVTVQTPALVNAGQTAYARVLYPQPLFEAMMPGLAAMAPVDQVGLLQDAVALGNSGYAPASNVLEVATHIPASADPLVWERVTSALVEIDDDYDPSPRRNALRARAVALLKPVLARLGTAPRAGDGPDDAILRAQLIRALGRMGDTATVAEERALYASGKGTAAERNAALAIVGAKATPADFDGLLAKARATSDPLEKLRYYRALASAEDGALAQRVADIVLGSEIPAGTSPALIAVFARAHPDLAWKLVVPRLDEPAAGMNRQMQWEEAMVVAGQSADPARIADYRAYLAAQVPADAQKAMMGAIGSIELNHRVATQALPDIDRWLAAHPS
jgi:aminopeptidase N